MRPSKIAPIVLLLGALVAPSGADAVVAITVPGSYLVGYATPQTVTAVGGPVVLVNTDVQPHNFVAQAAKRTDGSAPWCASYPSGRCPLFWSEAVSTGGVTMVQGLADVESGTTYVFFCSIHSAMVGILNIA